MTENEARIAFLAVSFALLFLMVWWIEGRELRKSVLVRGSQIE